MLFRPWPPRAILPPPAKNLPPVVPGVQPVFPRHSGRILRAFGAFLAFFQSGATGSASADSPACDVTLSRISDLGVRRCILVYFGDLRPPEWVPPRRVRTLSGSACCPALSSAAGKNDLLHYFPPMSSKKHFVLPVRCLVGCFPFLGAMCKNLTAGKNASPRSRNGQIFNPSQKT
jgi:hypothetical protein